MTITINGTTGVAGVDGTAATPALQGNDTDTGVYFGTNEVYISTGGTLRATVGNSGLTLTTPLVFPAGAVGAPSITTTGDINTGIYFPAADTIGFVEGGVESMRLDSSGNLGLGVTPSAWFAAFKAIQIGAGGSAITGQTNSPSFRLWANAYADSNNDNRYISSSNYALQYNIDGGDGKFKWFIAPSGTAGNAISFTQAMTLDVNGRLGIGNTGPSYLLDIKSNVSTTPTAISLTRGSSSIDAPTSYSLDGGYIGVSQNNGGTFFRYLDIVASGTSGTASSIIRFFTNSGSSSSEERARIDASGNLLVGTTSGGGISDGGATNPGVGLERVGTITAQRNNDANMFLSKASGYTNGDLINFYVNNSRKGVISTDGTNTTYGTSSDISLKENISDAASALASILTMPIRQFDWKVGGHTDYGVVAQEADGYAPEIVTKGDIWAVDYGRITPRLIKAFQELAAKVSALEAKQQ